MITEVMDAYCNHIKVLFFVEVSQKYAAVMGKVLNDTVHIVVTSYQIMNQDYCMKTQPCLVNVCYNHFCVQFLKDSLSY